MNILRAEHLGFCFGVRDALALAKEESTRAPLSILGDLVHNPAVMEELAREGVRVERNIAAIGTESVMITAHGTSDRRLAELRARGHRVLEATCPLVRHAHTELAQLVRSGFHPLVIGQRGHVEVEGLVGDYEAYDIILSESDIEALTPRDRWGVVAQTTQPVARVRHLVAQLQARFPKAEIRYRDTVCLPTKQRQSAAETLAQRCDVVVVVGGEHSNNTRELAATCSRYCARVHHIQLPSDLRKEWFRAHDTVGLTAGTSTPDSLIGAVELALHRIATAVAEPTPSFTPMPTHFPAWA